MRTFLDSRKLAPITHKMELCSKLPTAGSRFLELTFTGLNRGSAERI